MNKIEKKRDEPLRECEDTDACFDRKQVVRDEKDRRHTQRN